jgi:hypothetical protein
MAVTLDWYPTSRTAQLVMAKNWVVILTAKGMEWKVPPEEAQALGAAVTEADSALAAAESDVTRTPVVTARCREVFDRMKAIPPNGERISWSLSTGTAGRRCILRYRWKTAARKVPLGPW